MTIVSASFKHPKLPCSINTCMYTCRVTTAYCLYTDVKKKTPHLKVNVDISKTDQTKVMNFSALKHLIKQDFLIKKFAERIFEAEKTTSV